MVTLKQSSSLPPVSLIIPSRNRPDLLRETIESILEGENLPAELIIVDQSEEPHPDLASRPKTGRCELRYIHATSSGAGRARNVGIATARHGILVFTDDDVLVTPSWLRHLVGALLRGGKRSVVTGRVLPATPDRTGGFVPSTRTDPDPVDYEGRIGEDILYSNNMALFRSAIDEVGDFDTRLTNAEDNELAFRLLEAGYRILYRPEAVLYHRAWRSDEDYLALRWSYGRGQGEYYAKHLTLRDPYILNRLLREFGVRIARLVRAILVRPRQAKAQIVYLAAFVCGVLSWPVTQRRRPSGG